MNVLSGYPPDEAGSLETFRYRQSQAPALFLGAYVPESSGRRIIGYVCATTSSSPSVTHESMSVHESGPSVCIHSVCVAQEYRRKGVALALLKEYLSRLGKMETSGIRPERALVIAHEELTGLYEKSGFELVGKSSVVHGSRPWYELRKELSPPSAPVEPPTMPAGIWEQLQLASTSRKRPQAQLLVAFPNGAQDLVSDDGQGTLKNKYDILCPRDGCGSVILTSGAASLVERASVQLDQPGNTSASPLAPLPPPPVTINWWLVTPNVMTFENIGFTNSIISEAASKKIKLLICAECDLGPLGWCEEGGSEFWLASSRVGYRQ